MSWETVEEVCGHVLTECDVMSCRMSSSINFTQNFYSKSYNYINVTV